MHPVECRELSKRYRERSALAGVTMHVPEGSITAVVGENGAGKTTLLRLVVGLMRPTSGTVSLWGMDPRVKPEVRERLGYVPERPALDRRFTGDDLARLSLRVRRRFSLAAYARAMDELEVDGSRKVDELSKGMQTRLALALALAQEPDLMVLDEPTEGLDPLVRRRVLAELIGLAAGFGATVLFTAHVLGEVERVADRVIVLVGGRCRLEAPLHELRASEHMVRLRFDAVPSPATLRALAGVRSVHVDGDVAHVHYSGPPELLLAMSGAREVLGAEAMDLESVYLSFVEGRA